MRIKNYTYWDSLTKVERTELAKALNRTPAYLRLVFKGNKSASAELAQLLQKVTDGAVSRSDMRPDIYPDEECGEFKRATTTIAGC